MNAPWYSGKTYVLCSDDPVYDLIIGDIEGIHCVCDMVQVNHFEEEDILLEEDMPVKDATCSIHQNEPTPVVTEIETQTLGCVGKSSSDESTGDRNIEPFVVRYPVDINTYASYGEYRMEKRDRKTIQGIHVLSWYDIKK